LFATRYDEIYALVGEDGGNFESSTKLGNVAAEGGKVRIIPEFNARRIVLRVRGDVCYLFLHTAM